MFTGSIKISELDALSAVLGRDFFPVVQSGSLTTYRVTVSILNDWFRVSGSALSASWASRSLDSVQTVSASWASRSLDSVQTVSASWATSSLSSSLSTLAQTANTASYVLNAVSASYAPFSQSVQVSASYASASLSASYAVSASFAPAIGDTVPIGAIIAFPTASIPNNYLECNGDAKLTASFLDLYNAIRTTHPSASYGFLCDSFGNRDSSGFYFKIPDFRGEFLRGWDNGRGVDTSRQLASSQTASVGNHFHGIGTFTAGTNDNGRFILRNWNDGDTYNARGIGGSSGISTIYIVSGSSSPPAALLMATSNPVNTTGDIRPRNVSVVYCIKYSNAFNYANLVSSSLAGDVVGNTSATNVVAIQSVPITSSAPIDGQVLTYSSADGKWVPTTPTSTGLVAWATVLIPTASNYSSDNSSVVANGNLVNKPVILNGYNVSDVSWTARTIDSSAAWNFGKPALGSTKEAINFLVTLTNPASNLNYCVMGSWSETGAQAGNMTDEGIVHFDVLAARLSTQFTCSVNGGEFSGNPQTCWLTFAVYS
jgi:hypothetical protein